MAGRNDNPQKAAMREMMLVLLVGVLDEELGYSKYDYRNKETDNITCMVLNLCPYIYHHD